MNIIFVDLQDGYARIPVVVEDAVAESRLRRFINEGMAALTEKLEAEVEEES